MSSTICFNLDKSKILSSGKGLKSSLCSNEFEVKKLSQYGKAENIVFSKFSSTEKHVVPYNFDSRSDCRLCAI